MPQPTAFNALTSYVDDSSATIVRAFQELAENLDHKPYPRKTMMKPTKVWTFNEIYSVEVLDGNKLTAKVIIDWTCGQALYDRACLDLFSVATELAENKWTASECEHCRVEGELAMQSFSIVNQFVDEDEALRLAREFKDMLKDLSGLP